MKAMYCFSSALNSSLLRNLFPVYEGSREVSCSVFFAVLVFLKIKYFFHASTD